MVDLERLSVRDWELLRLTTDAITVDVVPGLGGAVVSLRRRSDDAEMLWSTPWGLRLRGAVSLSGAPEALMMDSFPGGWQTVFPTGDDPASLHGVDSGSDGEARLTPFDWERTAQSVVMTARLVRSPFELTKIISLNGAQVTIGETVKNVGEEVLEVMWGSQVVLGPPLVGPETVVHAAATTVHPDPVVTNNVSYDDIMPWPRTQDSYSTINLRTVPGPESGQTRMAYLSDFNEPTMRVTNPRLGLGVDLEWDGECWPYVWYSLEAGRRAGFPWHGKGYFLALTPSTSWPAHGLADARSVSHSTLWIQPGQASTSHLSVRVHPEPRRPAD